MRPLEKRLSLAGAKILVLGAGGAARAAVFGLVNKGAEVLILTVHRRPRKSWRARPRPKTIRREQVAKSSFDVIVNATAVGMHGVKPQHILEAKEINCSSGLRPGLQPGGYTVPAHGSSKRNSCRDRY